MPSSPINRSDYTATSPIQPTSSPCINLQVSPYLSRWRLKYAFYTLVLNSRRPKGLTPIPSHPPPRTPSEFLAQWSLITLAQRRLPWAGRYGLGQGWVYRIEKSSNADISDFSVYRRVYHIKPPISSISIFSKPVIFLSFFVENSPKIQKVPRKFWKSMNQSPQQQQQRRKFQKFAENSENSPKIP